MEKIFKAVALSVVIILLSSCAKTNQKVDDIITSNNSTHEVTSEEFKLNVEQFKESYKQRYIANIKKSNPEVDAEEQWKLYSSNENFINYIKNVVLESIVMDKIFYDEAVKSKLVPSEEEVNKKFDEVKAKYESEDKLLEDLKNNNLTVEKYKDSIKKQIAVQNFANSKNKLITNLKPTDEELKKVYENDKSKYNTIKISHILVDTQKQASDIKDKIDKGESFEDLAKEFSKCSSGKNGGDLGYHSANDNYDKDFLINAFNLKVNEISEPVKTQFGYHIIKVTDKIDSYEKANKDELKTAYLTSIQQKMYENYILNAKVKLPVEAQAIWDNLTKMIKEQSEKTSEKTSETDK